MKRDEQDAQSHYALRKLGKDLISVSVGLVFAGMLSDKEMNQVKAAAMPDNRQVSQIKSNQEVVAFGKIIPVNQNMEPIPNAPTPEYRRDPDDPNKAIATPIPEIKDYDLAKKDQAENVDLETKMVLPPANVAEDTKIVYVKQPTNNQKPNSSNSQRPNSRPVIVYPNHAQVNKPTNSTIPAQRPIQANPNQNSTLNWAHQVPASSQLNQNATISSNTQNIPGNNYQIQTNSPTVTTQNSENTQTTITDQNTSIASQDEASKAENTEEKKKLAKNDKKAARSKKAKAKSHKTTSNKKTAKAQPKTKKQPTKQFNQMPQVIVNPETKLPPKPQKAVLTIRDSQQNKQLLQLESSGLPGSPIDFSEWNQTLTDLQEKGYELATIFDKGHDQKLDLHRQFIFGFYGEDKSEFVADFKHKLVAVSAQNLPSNISASLVKKTVSLVVRYRGVGSKTPKDNVQNAVFTRTLTMDKVTRELIKDGKFTSPWRPQPLSYQAVVSPKVNGFKPDIAVVPKMAVVMDDVIKTVTYTPIERVVQKAQLPSKVAKPKKVEAAPVPVKKDSTQEKQPIVFKPKPKIDKIKSEPPVKKEPVVQKLKIKKVEVKKVTNKNNTQKTGLASVECHFVDLQGKTIHPETKVNPQGILPAVDGYYLVGKEANKSGLTATYAKMANIVPVDPYGNLIPEPLDPTKAVAPMPFKADVRDPKKAASHQSVPKIAGWQPTQQTVSPENNTIDIPVVYTKIKK